MDLTDIEYQELLKKLVKISNRLNNLDIYNNNLKRCLEDNFKIDDTILGNDLVLSNKNKIDKTINKINNELIPDIRNKTSL